MVIKNPLVQSEANAQVTLAIYRICFGCLTCFSLLRFMYNDWVNACFLSGDFHFTYQYFDWIAPAGNSLVMHGIVIAAAVSAACVALGLFYRFAIICFFFLFTYLELIEQSWYLNHYYFVSIAAFLLIFIPADNALAVGVMKQRVTSSFYANVLRFQISLVYWFAGLAKLHSDWLLEALPLRIWLKAKTDIPIIGPWLAYDEVAYIFSYAGAAYDLFIPFFLWFSRSRPYALVAVAVFHVLTAIMFPIGMFPWVMIAGSLVFVTDKEWQSLFKISSQTGTSASVPYWLIGLFSIHFILQIFLPLRRFAYPENQLWTERNYRFGWNVMLAEKAGMAVFYVTDNETDQRWTEYPAAQLTDIQEKQMAYQPDMIWQYACHLGKQYRARGHDSIQVFVTCYVSFNGRPSRLYLPGNLDLLSVSRDEIYDYVENE